MKTTVKEFKKLINSLPERYDDYIVMDQGTIDLEWISLWHKEKGLVIEFGNHPSNCPVVIEETDV